MCGFSDRSSGLLSFSHVTSGIGTPTTKHSKLTGSRTITVDLVVVLGPVISGGTIWKIIEQIQFQYKLQ